jgi:hypothetical protein
VTDSDRAVVDGHRRSRGTVAALPPATVTGDHVPVTVTGDLSRLSEMAWPRRDFPARRAGRHFGTE